MNDLITSIPLDKIKKYVIKQINTFFPDESTLEEDDKEFNDAFLDAIKRVNYCFHFIKLNGYSSIDSNGEKHSYFQHTNSDQYAQFLYFLSNSLWKMYPHRSYICDKLILLNKMLHCCWYTYKVNLPDIFLLGHPVGSVIGHAIYNNFLVILQNVTIGDRRFTTEPIGKFCFLSGGAMIIGCEKIGDRVSIGANTTVFRTPIPDNSIVFTDKKTGEINIVKNNKDKCKAENFFDLELARQYNLI